MTCHSEVTAAFESLYSATARSDFSPAEVLRQLRSTGSAYADSTVRTHVCAHMINDGTLLKVGPGRYRLARHRHHPVETSNAVGPMPGASSRITEDEVKHAVKAHLEADGWTVAVAWGRERGIDIDAHRGTERLVIEAKGEAPAGPQQVNYFLGALGELVQRMTDPLAVYGLALPDHRQYRGLVERLSTLASERLRLMVLWVARDPHGELRVSPPRVD